LRSPAGNHAADIGPNARVVLLDLHAGRRQAALDLVELLVELRADAACVTC